MSDKFEICKKELCNGCGVCSLKCPKKAIKMLEDSEGFFYPIIDEEKCVKCGICKRNCSYNNVTLNSDNPKIKKAYAAYNNNKKKKQESSSGGIFSAIAKYILEHDGVIFGACYDDNLKVYHDYISHYDDLKKFNGSKYSRSDLGDSFEKVKSFLENERYVLFSGTPCQCNSLKLFLGKEYQKLVTCEIICHANPSPKVFDLYKKNIEIKYNKKIKYINFRDKSTGWKNQTPIIYFNDGSFIEDKSYLFAFELELINRPSCHNCNYSSTDRFSDFTIGDFWGYEFINCKIKDDDTGISLMCINSDKGLKIFNDIKDNITVEEVDFDLAFKYNHNSNLKPHINRDKFFKKLNKGEINSNNIIEMMNYYVKNPIYIKILNKIAKLFKK